MSSNHFTITGNISEPKLAYTQNGKAYLSFSVADQKSKKNDQGGYDNVSDTLWVRVTIFGDDAETAAEHYRKGDTVTAAGRLIARKYSDQQGVERIGLELDFPTVAKVMRAPRQQQGYQQPQTYAAPAQPQADPWATPASQQQASTWPDEPVF